MSAELQKCVKHYNKHSIIIEFNEKLYLHSYLSSCCSSLLYDAFLNFRTSSSLRHQESMSVSIPESSISQNRLISAIPGIDTGIAEFWTSLRVSNVFYKSRCVVC